MAQFKATEEHRRLDKIVVNHYGNTLYFDSVLAANPHLTNVILNVGDVVELPILDVIDTVDEVLW